MGASDRSVSVVVPVHGSGEDLRRCLDALARCVPRPREVIVVADGDLDAAAIAREAGANVVALSQRGGPARARNAGAASATGDIVMFVDADVAVHEDAIAVVEAAFADRPHIVGIFGSYDAEPTDPGFLSQYKNLLHHWTHQQASERASTFWAGCGAIRREAFLDAGGFDERYTRPCIEDIELGHRMVRSGAEIRVEKRLQATHLKRWTIRSLLRADVLDRALPWSELIVRERTLPNALNVGVGARLSTIAVLVLLLASVATPFTTVAPWVFVGAGVVLSILNARFYAFLARVRGALFALRAIPWHWLSFAYGGAAFALAVFRAPSMTRRARITAPMTIEEHA